LEPVELSTIISTTLPGDVPLESATYTSVTSVSNAGLTLVDAPGVPVSIPEVDPEGVSVPEDEALDGLAVASPPGLTVSVARVP
jgi:hypothetical protein